MNNKHKFWLDYFELKNGRVKVFRRKNVSTKFYARFTFRNEKGYVQESLKTSDKNEAEKVALEKYLEYEFRQNQGLSIKSKKFKDITTEYLAHLKAQFSRKEIIKDRYRNWSTMIDRYFEPYFGEMPIADITKLSIESYREWRKNYWVDGLGSKKRKNVYQRDGKVITASVPKSWKNRVPTTSTLNNEETALRSIFKFAINKGYLSEREAPVIKTEAIRWSPRSTFAEKEYLRLLSIGRSRIKEAIKNKRDREAHQRFMCYHYVLIAANSGARVAELMNLKWSDITWHDKDKEGNSSILFDVSGKAKERTLVANDECRDYLNRIQVHCVNMSEKYNYKLNIKTGYVFVDYRGVLLGSFKKSFDSWCSAAGLLYDSKGKKRCLSSLRIYYCTMRLLKGDNIDLYDLALQMGTSIQMLQKTYSRLTARLKANKIKRQSGIRSIESQVANL